MRVLARHTVKLRGREQRHHPVTPIQRIVHRSDEIPARGPVPHIQLNAVPGLGQLPGHPLRPRPVRTSVTDEEIDPLPTHATSIPAGQPGYMSLQWELQREAPDLTEQQRAVGGPQRRSAVTAKPLDTAPVAGRAGVECRPSAKTAMDVWTTCLHLRN